MMAHPVSLEDWERRARRDRARIGARSPQSKVQEAIKDLPVTCLGVENKSTLVFRLLERIEGSEVDLLSEIRDRLRKLPIQYALKHITELRLV